MARGEGKKRLFNRGKDLLQPLVGAGWPVGGCVIRYRKSLIESPGEIELMRQGVSGWMEI